MEWLCPDTKTYLVIKELALYKAEYQTGLARSHIAEKYLESTW
jgi:hypothetical protein